MKHENNIPFLSSKSIEDNVFFYRMDCLGGVPWVVYLYDQHGTDGINIYNKDIVPTLNHCLHIHNGIYPAQDIIVVEAFCKDYITAIKNCDVIGFWPHKKYYPELKLIEKYCHHKAVAPPFNSGHFGEVFWFNRENWYEKLKGKKILIISSHCKTMEKQWFSNNLFKSHNKNINYSDTGIELSFVKPPMSACKNTPHSSWIESLDYFKRDVDETIKNFDLDLAIVSCGGYSSPICNYIHKKYGKSVVCIGGALQLYFSILGNRWRVPHNLEKYQFEINQYWTKLDKDQIPINSHLIENGCYF